MTDLKRRLDRLEGNPRTPRPCFNCEGTKRATRIFFDYLKARGVDASACKDVPRVGSCGACGARVSINVAGWTPEDFELNRRYYRAVLGEGTLAEQEAIFAQYMTRLAELGTANYGEHYAGANAALTEAMGQWWADAYGVMSDDELLAVAGGIKWAAA
ncbi:MAG: hypothetical protein H0X14_00090 [Acidobacteria bacterium]|nr:hypothetical protein [Acidobacteriota bacterium]